MAERRVRQRVRQTRWQVKRRTVLLGCGFLALLAGGWLTTHWVRNAGARERAAASLEEGYAALKAGQYDEARQKIGPWLQHAPEDVAARYAYAQANRHVEQPDGKHLTETFAFLRQVLDHDPSHRGARRDLLHLLMSLGQTREVQALTQHVEPRASALPIDLEARSWVLVQEGQPRAALEYAIAGSEAEPQNLLAHLRVLHLMNEVGEPASALADRVEQAAAALPEAEASLLRAHLHHLRGEHEAAATLGLAVAPRLGAQPETVQAALRLLDGYGEVDASLDLLRRATDDAADDPNALALQQQLLDRLWQRGHYEEVLQRSTTAADRPMPNSTLLAVRGLALAELEREQEVAAIADRLEQRGEGTSAALWAEVLRVWPRTDGLHPVPVDTADDVILALKDVRQAGGHPILQTLLAGAMEQAGEGRVALLLYEQASQLAPTWAVPRRHHIRLLLESGEALAAAEETRRAVGMHRHDPQVLTEAAEVVARLSSDSQSPGLDEALKLLDRALELDPSHQGARALKANILLERGEPEAARELLRPMLDEGERLSATPRVALRVMRLAPRLDLDATLLMEPGLYADADARHAVLWERYEQAGVPIPTSEDPALQLMEVEQRLRAGDSTAAAAWNALLEAHPMRVDILQRVALGGSDVTLRRKATERLAQLVDPIGMTWPCAAVLLELEQADATGISLPEQALARLALSANEVVRAYERQPQPKLVLAEVLLRLGQPEEALQQLENAAELIPQDVPLRLKLAALWQDQGDYAAADRHLVVAERVAGRPSARVGIADRRTLGALLSHAGETRRALAVLQALPREKGNADLQLLRLQYLQGTLDDASLHALMEDGDRAGLMFAAGVWNDRGDLAAVEAAVAGLDAGGMAKGELARFRAELAARRGDLAEAVRLLEDALREQKSDALAWQALVTLRLAYQQPREALQAAREASTALPEEASFRFATSTLERFEQDPSVLKEVPQLAEVLIAAVLEPADRQVVEQVLDQWADHRARQTPTAEWVASLGAAAASAPRLVPLQMMTAWQGLHAGDPESLGIAYAAADRVAKIRPTLPEAAEAKARAKAQQGDWAAALDLAGTWENRLEAAKQSTLPAVTLKAQARLVLNQPARAVALLRPYHRQMVETPHQFLRPALLFADASARVGSPEVSLDLLRPLLATEPNARDLWIRVAAEHWPDVAEAAAMLREVEPLVRAGEPGEALHLVRGWLHWEQRGDVSASARPSLLEALASRVLEDQALSGAFALQVATLGGDVLTRDQKMALYRRVLRDQAEPVAMNNLAMLLVEEPTPAHLEEARQYAEKLADLPQHPLKAYFLDTLATVQAAAGDFDAAAQSLYAATRADSDNPRWFAHLAEVQVRQQRPEAARENYEQARRLARDRSSVDAETTDLLERLEEVFR